MHHHLSNTRSDRDARIAHWNWGARERLNREDGDQLWAAYQQCETARRELESGELTESEAGITLAEARAEARARLREYKEFISAR